MSDLHFNEKPLDFMDDQHFNAKTLNIMGDQRFNEEPLDFMDIMDDHRYNEKTLDIGLSNPLPVPLLLVVIPRAVIELPSQDNSIDDLIRCQCHH
jgi:hypothetical protein